MSYSIIAAIGKNNELGYKNNLIWHLPNDLKFFKKVTNGKTIIMGRNTFESLPKMLPNRNHVILSSHNDFNENVIVYNNINDLFNDFDNIDEELFIIGGEKIYRLFLDKSDKLYITRINDSFDKADAFFPIFDKSNYDEELIDSNVENNISYEHILYKRKK